MRKGIPAAAAERARMHAMNPPATVTRRPARRAGVVRRALRREASRIREPRRIAAMAILIVSFALALAGMTARGDTAGADAQAYWAAVRIWLEGGDPYHPLGPFLPYVYAPWMLPLFIPWALLPWEVAWFAWRGATILLLLWSIRWAYARRPLPTAILVGLLAFPMAANLDTGNINLLLALALFGAHFTGPRVGGLIWGLATWMKWVPALLWPMLPPKARAWGLVFLALSGLLSLLMLPLTIIQLQVAVRVRGAAAPGGLPRVHLVRGALVVAAAASRSPSCIRPRGGGRCAQQRDRARRWGRAFRTEPGATIRLARLRGWSWIAPLPRPRRAGARRASRRGARFRAPRGRRDRRLIRRRRPPPARRCAPRRGSTTGRRVTRGGREEGDGQGEHDPRAERLVAGRRHERPARARRWRPRAAPRSPWRRCSCPCTGRPTPSG